MQSCDTFTANSYEIQKEKNNIKSFKKHTGPPQKQFKKNFKRPKVNFKLNIYIFLNQSCFLWYILVKSREKDK
jgi:hypothetical protein